MKEAMTESEAYELVTKNISPLLEKMVDAGYILSTRVDLTEIKNVRRINNFLEGKAPANTNFYNQVVKDWSIYEKLGCTHNRNTYTFTYRGLLHVLNQFNYMEWNTLPNIDEITVSDIEVENILVRHDISISGNVSDVEVSTLPYLLNIKHKELSDVKVKLEHQVNSLTIELDTIYNTLHHIEALLNVV